ncbi:MAG TPA: LysE/ArgO family amino acid transporter [Alphaproteobacteria bacterium]|nr:LysE/ArgO family amino acid transporter [Alphaproteobacteria bacterium]
MTAAYFTGLLASLGLIVAIGAQNAFVIRQGLLRRHVFVVATICFLCDAVLIALGIAGLGALIAADRWLTAAAAWGGAIFLIVFGLRAAWNALRSDHKGFAEAEAAATVEVGAKGGQGRRAAVAAALAFSLLNPHVYLDTVVLLGGIGAQYPVNTRYGFLAGGVTGSLVWFYAIGFGAMIFTPLFRKPIATRLLDGFVAAVMFAVAGLLLTGALGAGR